MLKFKHLIIGGIISCLGIAGLSVAIFNQTSEADQGPYITDRVLVVLAENKSLTSFSDSLSSLTEKHSLTKELVSETFYKSDSAELQRYISIDVPENTDAQELLKDLENDPSVVSAGYEYKLKAFATTPTDPSFGVQWGLYNTGQTVNGDPGVADKDIDAELAWDIYTGDSNVVIAVIDTGLEFSHDEFSSGHYWMNAGEMGGGKETDDIDNDLNGKVDDWRGWDFIGGSVSSPAEDNVPNDSGNGHGSHVSGIIAAETNNGTGIAGVDWSAKVMAVKGLDDSSLGEGSISTIANSIIYAADNGADVINLSLGSDPDLPPSSSGIAQLQAAIDYAYGLNVVVVAAAGNNGTNLSIKPVYPVCNDGGADKVLGVAATDNNDNRLASSNYSGCVDVAGPGQNIYGPHNTGDSVYSYRSGTSQASPYAAGLASLIRGYNGALSNAGIQARIESGADDIAASGIGSGRINALNSLTGSTPRIQLNQTPIRGSSYTVYYIDGGKKRSYISSRVFNTWTTFEHVHKLYDTQVQDYIFDVRMGFRDGTLIRASSSPTVYVIEDGKRKAFTSGAVFTGLGYSYSRILVVTNAERDLHASGTKIDSTLVIPDDTLVKGSGPTVYYIDGGQKRAFTSGNVFKTWGTYGMVNTISDSKLGVIASGPQMGFRSGFLIKGTSPTVYVIEDDLRRAFTSGTVFAELGYSFANVMTVSDTDLTKNTPGAKVE
ncbi:S8 family serine peptidase [Patescibacteria group bacterium]